MKKLIVLIPEGVYLDYFVYSYSHKVGEGSHDRCEYKRRGRIRYRGAGTTGDEIADLIRTVQPTSIALRVLYGGNEFKKEIVFDNSVLPRLENLISQSPLDIPPVIRLIKRIMRVVPTPEVILFFETSFFVGLPYMERTYAVADSERMPLEEMRRFGYHGVYHEAASKLVSHFDQDARRVISICLEPVPEVVGIYDGKPIVVSGGSTPLEGLAGNTTCGEIDPGIVLLLEEKKGWGPEKINDVLTRKSGLTALAGRYVTIEHVFSHPDECSRALDFLRYRILLYAGSAAGVMNGVDAVVFSGRYRAGTLADWLTGKLADASANNARPPFYYLDKTVDRLMAEGASRIIRRSQVCL